MIFKLIYGYFKLTISTFLRHKRSITPNTNSTISIMITAAAGIKRFSVVLGDGYQEHNDMEE